MAKNMKQKRLKVFLAGACALLVSMSGQALAQGGGAEGATRPAVPPPEKPEIAPLTGPGQGAPTQGSAVAALDQCEDCECRVKANTPHLSHHQRDRVNGEIRVECKHNQPHIKVTAQLWETRWWGWDRIGALGETTKKNKRKVSAFSNSGCNDGMTLRVTGDGTVTKANGDKLTGGAESKHVTIEDCND